MLMNIEFLGKNVIQKIIPRARDAKVIYQVIPVDSIGNTHMARRFNTLAEARMIADPDRCKVLVSKIARTKVSLPVA